MAQLKGLRERLWGWQGRRKRQRLPEISVAATADYYKAFTAPNPTLHATIRTDTGDVAGSADFGVSPLFDRVYLFDIRIDPAHRRRGYATAFLWHLVELHCQPITAVKELHGARRFWDSARKLRGVGLVVTAPLSVSQMSEEASRWRHLRPQVERLDALIAERFSVHREPYHRAAGRGLDDWPAAPPAADLRTLPHAISH